MLEGATGAMSWGLCYCAWGGEGEFAAIDTAQPCVLWKSAWTSGCQMWIPSWVVMEPDVPSAPKKAEGIIFTIGAENQRSFCDATGLLSHLSAWDRRWLQAGSSAGDTGLGRWWVLHHDTASGCPLEGHISFTPSGCGVQSHSEVLRCLL